MNHIFLTTNRPHSQKKTKKILQNRAEWEVCTIFENFGNPKISRHILDVQYYYFLNFFPVSAYIFFILSVSALPFPSL